MRRLVLLVLTTLVALLLAVPGAIAADAGIPHNGRVLISTSGDVTVPAGEHADTVVVVRGHATIGGQVNTLVVIEGSAELAGARTETIVAVRSPVTVGAGTVVLGDVMQIDSAVTRLDDARINGSVRDLGLEIAGAGFLLGPLFLAMYVGFAVAAIAAALLLAALAARQVRAAESLIRHEPGSVVLAGFAGIFLPIFVIAALFVSVIGVPLALGIMLGLWPLAAFVGYLVAAIAVGEWVVSQFGAARERPYVAAVVGVLILQVVAFIPILGAIPAFVGFGAVLLLAWRTIRFGSGPRTVAPGRPVPSPGPA